MRISIYVAIFFALILFDYGHHVNAFSIKSFIKEMGESIFELGEQFIERQDPLSKNNNSIGTSIISFPKHDSIG